MEAAKSDILKELKGMMSGQGGGSNDETRRVLQRIEEALACCMLRLDSKDQQKSDVATSDDQEPLVKLDAAPSRSEIQIPRDLVDVPAQSTRSLEIGSLAPSIAMSSTERPTTSVFDIQPQFGGFETGHMESIEDDEATI